MNVSDKINYLLVEKGISKREFAQKLLSLNPILDKKCKLKFIDVVYKEVVTNK